MTALTVDQLAQIKSDALASLKKVADAAGLEEWRVEYMGRKGVIPQLLRGIKDLPETTRAAMGTAANETRSELTAAYEQAATQFGAVTQRVSGTGKQEAVVGHLHAITETIRSIQTIMTGIGFTMVEGPLLEDTQHDFDNLNIGPEHPARAETDTFYVSGGPPENRRVLRTSTSSVQVRAVQELKRQPPFKIFSPGRTFRNEKVDARHHHTFHQLELLSVGEDVTVADFKGVIETLFSELFGTDVKARLRPHYFPFTEPSFEADLTCIFCDDGCRVCKGTGWIEIGGAGMVHPLVLEKMDIDPQRYQGFALGYGIERMAMLKYGIDDVRLFLDNDMRFLRQF
ncbi:phenylalanine--tRNA ligase subunit alpha [bacterium]|nr:phenylalanine--tRNA ligase subunit alpha [bacterium]